MSSSIFNFSFFNTFFRAVKPVEDILPPTIFSLPQVVILGTEKAGKSSLLENILKTEIFPRGIAIVTKCPMRFELTGLAPGATGFTEIVWDGVTKKIATDSDILVEVKRVMDSIGDDVVPKELTVRRSAPNLPSVTFIDLPGLRSTTGLKEKTEALASTYLGGDNVFVLVVPAANNIYSDAAYGLVTAKGKAASTILVLSKCDLAARDDVGWHTTVVPRLLGKDAELKKHLFKSVVATKCRQQDRTSKDTIPLDKADEDERAWAVAQLKITDVTPAEREQLQSRMTVLALLTNMDETFHGHATGQWKTNALAKLTPAHAAAEKAVKDIGTAPESLTPPVLLDEVEARFKAGWLSSFPALPAYGGVTKPRNSREAADEAARTFSEVEAWLNAKLDPTRPADFLAFAELGKTIDVVFNDDKPDLRMKRFGNARAVLSKATRDKFITCATAYCPDIKRRALDQLDSAVCAGGPAPIAAILADVLSKVVYRCVGPALSVPSVLKADAAWKQANAAGLLAEDPAIAADRLTKMKKLQEIVDSMKLVANIEKRTEEGVSLLVPPAAVPVPGGAAASAAKTK